MSITFRCPVCVGEHRSRLLALRERYFHEVISQLGEIAELCPVTGSWTSVTYSDMIWKEEARADAGWI